MYYRLLFWFLPLAGFLGAAGCKSAQKAALYTPDTIVPQEKALLWKISGNGLKKPSFLFGTIHLIPKAEFLLESETRVAFDGAEQIAFEIDLKDMFNLAAQFNLLSKSMMAGGKTLNDLLPEEDYTFIKEKLSEKGLPMVMLERLKPMFLSMMLTTDEDEAGGGTSLDQMTSVEMELFQMAKNRRIKTTGLETMAYQMSIFDSIPYDVQARMLVETLRSKSGGNDEFAEMMRLYRAQDIQTMQSMVSSEASDMKNYEELLLNKRNKNWIPVMGKLMSQHSTFFAVGAGHLGGPEGVIALLRQAGYKVDAVNPAGG